MWFWTVAPVLLLLWAGAAIFVVLLVRYERRVLAWALLGFRPGDRIMISPGGAQCFIEATRRTAIKIRECEKSFETLTVVSRAFGTSLNDLTRSYEKVKQ